MDSNKLNKYIFLSLNELKHTFLRGKYIAMIDITNRCNLRCKHCYHKEMLSLEDNITGEEWERRFRKYQRMGIRYVSFIGGEPSIRYDVLRIAEKYFIFIETYTNGQIKIPEEFKHRIFLSLEGLEEEHDEICGKGTFKKAVNNYSGDKRVVVYTALSRMNYRGPAKLKTFIDFVRGMSILGIRFSSHIPRKGESEAFLLGDKDRREIGKILMEEFYRKDSILLMSKGMINFFVNVPLPNKFCAATRMYFFDNQDRQKHCVDPKGDCSRCFAIGTYDPPFYKFLEWLSHKWVLYKSLPK